MALQFKGCLAANDGVDAEALLCSTRTFLVKRELHRLRQAVASDRETLGCAVAGERPATGERLDPQLAADAR